MQTRRQSITRATPDVRIGGDSVHNDLVKVAGEPDFAWRYAGRLENGEESISDALMGGLI